MIEIDLMPLDLKRVRNLRKLFSLTLFLAGGIIFIFVLLHLFLNLSIFLERTYLKKLQDEWKSIEAEKDVISQLNREKTILQAKVRLFEEIGRERILWAKRLYELKEIIPSGVWLTRFYVTGSRIRLEGKVVSLNREEAKVVGEFMEALKKSLFLDKFKDLELTSFNKSKIKKQEIAEFILEVK